MVADTDSTWLPGNNRSECLLATPEGVEAFGIPDTHDFTIQIMGAQVSGYARVGHHHVHRLTAMLELHAVRY